MRALLLVAGVALAYWLYRRASARLGAARMRALLLWGAVAVALALILAAAGRGAASIAPLLLPLLVALLARLRSLITNPAPAGGRGDPKGRSEVETEYLRMTLELASGEMAGVVLRGAFEGRALAGLDRGELLALWQECQADPQSAAVLEAYLDRRLGGDWRAAAAGGDAPSSGGPMTREAAYRILGLPPGAGPEEIRAAHRRLMQRVHPDHGGSDYLASEINRAKDLLLRG